MNKLKKFDLRFLNKRITFLAGVDEAGRGPLAGPVIASAVIFKKSSFLEEINDSKKVSEKRREVLADWIKENAISYAYGIVDQSTIDEINILRATLLAMRMAVNNLSIKPHKIIIDGNRIFDSELPLLSVVKGDSKSFSIAAASILAKVKRDEIMKKYAEEFPEYDWHKNKGYGTKYHVNAIKKYGVTVLHRKTFLKKILPTEIQEELY